MICLKIEEKLTIVGITVRKRVLNIIKLDNIKITNKIRSAEERQKKICLLIFSSFWKDFQRYPSKSNYVVQILFQTHKSFHNNCLEICFIIKKYLP